MIVNLIDFTGHGHYDPADWAANILIYAKSTRLQMTPSLLESINHMPKDKKLKELEYIANTIPASHEFVDYHFNIAGVTRAFANQLVRTRTASFAQQTLRVLDVSGWSYATGPTITQDQERKEIYDGAMEGIAKVYDALIEKGAAIEDARGVLPLNILTNINMKINLRNFVDMVHKRSSPRVQDEYRQVIEAMKKEVLRVHPFVSLFIERTADRAFADLDQEIASLPDKAQATRMLKLCDQLRAKL